MFFGQINIPINDPSFWWLIIVLLVIALVVIIAIGFLFAFPIAALAAILVFFLTGSLLWTGLTFLIVALISAAIGDMMHMTRRHHHHHEEHHDDEDED